MRECFFWPTRVVLDQWSLNDCVGVTIKTSNLPSFAPEENLLGIGDKWHGISMDWKHF